LAAVFAEAGGRPVLDDAAWVAAMVEYAGMPEPVARMCATFGIAARQGYLGIVSATLQEPIGRPRTTVPELIVDQLAAASA
jgi:hypothetical protein